MESLAASSVESLLVILGIILLSSISNWLQRRRQSQGGGDGPTETAPTPRPVPKRRPESQPAARPAPPGGASVPSSGPTAPKPERRIDWEEELRRLLEGDLAPTPPPPRPPPPAPVTVQAPRPVAAPPPLRSPVPEDQDLKALGFQRGCCAQCGGRFDFPSAKTGETIVCPHCRRPTQLVPLSAPSLPPVMSGKELTSLRESAAAYQRASQLHQRVEERLQQTEARTERPLVAAPPPRRSLTSAEATETVALLRQPRGARQMMIASVVLGPPRALDQ
jgi:hypothetical protein